MRANRQRRSTRGTELTEYAAANKRRQAEWEPGFRERIEWVIRELKGPGAVQQATRIKSQTLQKIRKGGSRLALFAAFCEALEINPAWLLLGMDNVPRFMHAPSRELGVVADTSQLALPAASRRTPRAADSSRGRVAATKVVGNARRVR